MNGINYNYEEKILSLFLGALILAGTLDTAFATIEVSDSKISTNDFLLGTGMNQEEIDKMDSDIKEYMVQSILAIS